MAINLSTPPVPVLLTDQYNFTVPNGTHHFEPIDPSAQAYDEMIGLGTTIFAMLFVLSLYYYFARHEKWLQERRAAKRLSARISTRLDDRFDLSRIMEAGASDEALRSGLDSQDTTLEGSPSSGSETNLGIKGTGSRKDIRHGLDRFREFDDRWFR